MATVLLQETGSACMTAPQLAILGPKSYYRLELSEDGTVVRRLNAGCFEHTCSEYVVVKGEGCMVVQRKRPKMVTAGRSEGGQQATEARMSF